VKSSPKMLFEKENSKAKSCDKYQAKSALGLVTLGDLTTLSGASLTHFFVF
jgi:hypothetical protein